MTMLATIVETKDLLDTVAVSVVAGVGITVVFSVAVYGATRWADFNREERPAAAGASITLAIVALAACLAAMVLGIIVMTSK
jgi:hypothetical protein